MPVRSVTGMGRSLVSGTRQAIAGRSAEAHPDRTSLRWLGRPEVAVSGRSGIQPVGEHQDLARVGRATGQLLEGLGARHQVDASLDQPGEFFRLRARPGSGLTELL